MKGASGVELKGVIGSGFETERRREVLKSLRNRVHLADAVVWGPVWCDDR